MKYLSFLLFLLAMVSCGKAAKVPDPMPVKTYTADGISVNAFDFKSFREFLGRDNDTTYVINFWATWCKPCIEELPAFEKISNDYKEEKLRVILVSLDMKSQVENSLIPFIRKNELKSDVLLLSDPDANSWIPAIDSSWSGAIPATLIYRGNKSRFYEKSFSYESLRDEISNFK